MIRFPLDLPPVEKPPETWAHVIFDGIIILILLAFLIFFVLPALDASNERVDATSPTGESAR